MRDYKICLSVILLSILTIGFVGCSDDPASVDPENAPEPPTFEEIEPDFSIFEEAQNFSVQHSGNEPEDRSGMNDLLRSNMEHGSAYEAAAWYALISNSLFQSAGLFPSIYFNEQMWGEPEVQGDTWIWEYSYSFEGESMTMRVTAQSTNLTQNWELTYSYSGQEHEDFTNALLLSAQVYQDGSGGSWQFHDMFETDADPIYQVDYELDNGLTTLVDLYYDENGERFLFESDGTISTLRWWANSDIESELGWNNDTLEGYIESPDYNDGLKTCWDSNFQNTEC
jgi:hypothetical protein